MNNIYKDVFTKECMKKSGDFGVISLEIAVIFAFVIILFSQFAFSADDDVPLPPPTPDLSGDSSGDAPTYFPGDGPSGSPDGIENLNDTGGLGGLDSSGGLGGSNSNSANNGVGGSTSKLGSKKIPIIIGGIILLFGIATAVYFLLKKQMTENKIGNSEVSENSLKK